MIYVSTGGFAKYNANFALSKLLEYDFKNIEFSGGIYDQDQINKLKKFKGKYKFKFHNYFPPPKKNFIFNLASKNTEIAELSFNLAKSAIQYSVDFDCKVYSFHAGFFFDPSLSEFGKKISKKKLNDIDESTNIFIDKVNKLSKFASNLGISLLIENNVLSLANYSSFNLNPFLMVDEKSCSYIMENTPDNVNLLIDLGHLKVSSNTLNFSSVNFLNKCNKWILAYHISDNNGLSDTNDLIKDNSWFWPYIKKDLDYYSLEVYKTTDVLFDQYNFLKKKLEKIRK